MDNSAPGGRLTPSSGLHRTASLSANVADEVFSIFTSRSPQRSFQRNKERLSVPIEKLTSDSDSQDAPRVSSDATLSEGGDIDWAAIKLLVATSRRNGEKTVLLPVRLAARNIRELSFGHSARARAGGPHRGTALEEEDIDWGLVQRFTVEELNKAKAEAKASSCESDVG